MPAAAAAATTHTIFRYPHKVRRSYYIDLYGLLLKDTYYA